MVDHRIVEYIWTGLRQGYTLDSLRHALLKEGWKLSEINSAISFANMRSKQQNPPQYHTRPHETHHEQHHHAEESPNIVQNYFKNQAASHPQQGFSQNQQNNYHQQRRPVNKTSGANLGILQRFRMSLFHPNRLYEAVKNEEDFGNPVKFFVFLTVLEVVLLIMMIFLVITPFIGEITIDPLIRQSFGMAAIMLSGILLPITLLGGIICIFFVVGFYHIFAYIFGARKGYINTFKAMIYSYSPVVFLWLFVPFILMGFSNLLMLALPIVFIGILYLWSFILFIKALSRFHEISGFRAFLAVFVPIFITFVLFLSMILTVFLFAMGPFDPGTYTASTATGFNGFSVESGGWSVNRDSVQILLRNQLESDIDITDIKATYQGTSTALVTPDLLSGGGTMSPNDQTTFTLSGGDFAGPLPDMPYAVSIEITYKNLESGLTIRSSGMITGKASI